MSISEDAFLLAAAVPLNEFTAGSLDDARAILAADPSLGEQSIHAAAVVGNLPAVERFLTADPALTTTASGPHGWDPLTWCCFSRFFRDDLERRPAFRAIAVRLLDAGADVHTGFFDPTHGPTPTRETVLYAAAGIAFDAPLTQLLLDRGADPNDDEVPYHAAESYDHAVLDVLLASDTLNAGSLTTLLLRKADWHDAPGVDKLLVHGVDPNESGRWPWSPLYQAVRRDNDLRIIRAMLDHGGDVRREFDGRSIAAHAAMRGRGDVLRELRTRGSLPMFTGADAVLAACALDDRAMLTEALEREPASAQLVLAHGALVLRQFASIGNADGLAMLLSLGIPVDAVDWGSDGYHDVPPQSTALHVAAWRGRHDAVALLLTRGAKANALDGKSRTPLERAIAAATASHWTGRRGPESVAALLQHGADPRAVVVPTGYDAIDALLAAARDASAPSTM
jgi:ankyrin repeat protein